MLPDVVFGSLHQVIPGGVPAEGASSLWNPQIFGGGSWVEARTLLKDYFPYMVHGAKRFSIDG
jgi:N-methylhydantoinase B